MKLKVSNDRGYYPDVLIVCNDEDDESYFKQDACLVIEVLPEIPDATDRGEKLHGYLKLKSLEAYMLVDQSEQIVEVYRRTENGWLYEEKEAEEILSLPCVGLELPVSDLYTGI